MRLTEKAGFVLDVLRTRRLRGLVNLVLCAHDLVWEPESVTSQILYAQIEPTTACNLRCVACDVAFTPKERIRQMTLSQFQAILGRLPFLQKVSLVGVGETLLNPNVGEMVRYAKARGIRIGFATNGTFLNADRPAQLIEAGVDWLNVSMDGATKATFERIRVGANFEQVVENIRNLMRVVGRRKRPEVSVWFVARQDNLGELPALVRLVRTLGVRTLCVQGLHFWGKTGWRSAWERQQPSADLIETRQKLQEAQAVAKAVGVRFEYVNISDGAAERSCNWPWRACYITVEGFVTPCCVHGTDPNVLNFGNLLEQSFADIWNGERYREFRRQLKSPSPHSICVDCPSYGRKLEM